METEETYQEELENVMELDQDAQDFLYEGSKWSYFLSILGFVMIGIMVFAGLFMSLRMGLLSKNMGLPEGFMISFMWIFYLVMAVIYFFPVYYLYKFSTRVKSAIRNSDNFELTDSFRFFKMHYKFIGIAAIVMLVLYPVIMVLGAFGAIFGSL